MPHASTASVENIQANEKWKEELVTNIVRTARLTLRVWSLDSAVRAIVLVVQGAGGMIASEHRSVYADDRIVCMMQLRVPAERLDSLLTALEDIAEKVVEKSMTAHDVTVEYVDTEARLASARQLEQQYLTILKQARTVSDVLAVQEKLASVRADIEAREAQFRALSGRIQYSQIDITFVESFAHSQSSFSKRLKTAFDESWQGFEELVLWCVRLWYVIVFFVSSLFVVRWLRKKRSVSASSQVLLREAIETSKGEK
ncbi:MAG: DUF4349 domain-containing protein [Bacteroidota bacterium]|nr:DUF4349 domain-containing protein [Candidatus Kapabacteria bacterium]MDW8219625.1 DUF4349 domain-containing protein [Bacteroidota bacterium]